MSGAARARPRPVALRTGRHALHRPETTGLSSAREQCLLDAGWRGSSPMPRRWWRGQLVLRQLGEEAPMLSPSPIAWPTSALVTYNGKSFDSSTSALASVLNRMPPLPLLLTSISFTSRGGAPPSSLETRSPRQRRNQVLGFVRTADIAGGEVCSLTRTFSVRSATRWRRDLIHNEWDVVAMAGPVGLYGEPLEGLVPADWAALAERCARGCSTGGRCRCVRLRGGRARGGADAGRESRRRWEQGAGSCDFASLLGSVDDPGLRPSWRSFTSIMRWER